MLATRVFAPRGVEVLERHAGFEVRVATAESRCFVFDWPSASGARQDMPCPPTSVNADVTAANATEAFAPGSNVANALPFLGVSILERPRLPREAELTIVEHPLGASPGRSLGGEVTGLVPVGSERFLRLSIEGGLESHQLDAQVFASSGEAWGPCSTSRRRTRV
jgi:hypothetical protein